MMGVVPASRALAAAVITLGAILAVPAIGAADAPWPQYHDNAARSAVGPSAPALTPIRSAWTSPALDGQVYGEPLVANGLTIVATENDTVYGLDLATGQVRWSTHLGSPVPLSTLPCGNIDPLGITSTPILDPATNRVFVVAEERTTAGGVQHELVGLDALSGAIGMRRVVDPPGMDARAQQQRGALALSGGSIQIAFGGLDGDCSDYHGYVVSSREDGTGALGVFRTAGTEGGIWASGGPSVDAAGNVFVSTGNGGSTTAYDQGDSVLKLSPIGALLDSFAPTNWAADNAGDLDLGSSTPILLDGGLVFAVGKQRTAFLLNANHLGGIGGQLFSADVCRSFGAQAWAPPMLYVSCSDRGLVALRINSGPSPSFATAWVSPVSGIGPPVIGGGAVWTEDWNAGELYALDPNTGAVLSQVHTGAAAHFSTPTIVAGLALVAAGARIEAFSGPNSRPNATQGYWVASTGGATAAFGTAPNLGSLAGLHLAAPVVGLAATRSGHGYWLVAADGGVFNFGDATFHGSTGGLRLAAPVIGLAGGPSAAGYWLVAADGGVFSFGDATFHGSTGSVRLAAPIVALAPTPSGNGYWLVAADGGVFSFGDATFHGSTGGVRLAAPIVGMAASRPGRGYWLVARDGGIFNFGDAEFDGSAAGLGLSGASVGVATSS